MNAQFYFFVFTYLSMLVCLFYGAQYLGTGGNDLAKEGRKNYFTCIAIGVLLILWMGNRPVSSFFGDTVNYSMHYLTLENASISVNWQEEWGWAFLMQTCHDLGLDVHSFFVVVEAGYIIPLLLALRILMPKNPFLALLFCLTSFSFFTFGVNGLRNGMAVHIVLYGMSLWLDDKRIGSVITFLVAFSIHRSTALPIAAFLAAIYVVKKPRMALLIWVGSILLSLVAGNTFTAIFSSLGFDDRMEQYLTTEGNELENVTSKFRWDFLLYSAMPVLMVYVVTVKKKLVDNWYNVLGVTYCLANAFWVLVIRASFSNRFAFLSWFLYPVIIAYPLIQMDVWEDQDKKICMLLYGYVLLTFAIEFMSGMIYYVDFFALSM